MRQRTGRKNEHNPNEGIKRPHFHIAFLIFGAILIYLIATLIMYISSNPVTSYEVNTGSLSRSTVYTGLILRSENVVYAQNNGSVTYYQPETSKVKVGDNVCMTSLSKTALDAASDSTASENTATDYTSLDEALTSFQKGFQADNFTETYSFHEQLDSLILDGQNQEAVGQLDQLAASDPSSYVLSKAPVDGIISYHLDGDENLGLETITKSNLAGGKTEETDLRKDTEKSTGDPVYKIITSEDWSLVLPLDDATYTYLSEKNPSQVQVQIHKDNELLWGYLSLSDVGEQHVAVLSFDQGMIRYASERYLDVTLILENESGLKIPKSAIVEKKFYLVPSDYITQGGDSADDGVLLQSKNNSAVFTDTVIYKENEENGVVYLDSRVLSEGDVLINPDSGATFTVGESEMLKGVYNINKGYAVFKQIEILAENSEYCIIREGQDYGVSNYDFIALNGNSVQEDDLIN